MGDKEFEEGDQQTKKNVNELWPTLPNRGTHG